MFGPGLFMCCRHDHVVHIPMCEVTPSRRLGSLIRTVPKGSESFNRRHPYRVPWHLVIFVKITYVLVVLESKTPAEYEKLWSLEAAVDSHMSNIAGFGATSLPPSWPVAIRITESPFCCRRVKSKALGTGKRGTCRLSEVLDYVNN